jgi:hypothetical protein
MNDEKQERVATALRDELERIGYRESTVYQLADELARVAIAAMDEPMAPFPAPPVTS